MAEPSEDLQKAVLEALLNDPAVFAIVGTNITDGRPKSFPAITFSAESGFMEDYECIAGRRLNLQLDCWTREEAGRLRQAKSLRDKVVTALHAAQIDLDQHALANLQVETFNTFMDQDGETGHGVVSLSALIEIR